MKKRPSETPRPAAEREIMGSPGEWERSVGEPPEIMAGRARLDDPDLPYLMSSPGSWNSSAARDS
jgi:hypothetical protein